MACIRVCFCIWQKSFHLLCMWLKVYQLQNGKFCSSKNKPASKQTDRQIISIYQRSITEGQKLLKYEDWNSLSSTQKVSRSPQFSRRYLNIFACGGQMKQTNCAFYSSFSSFARKDSEVKFESIRQQIGTQIDNTTRKGQMGFIGGCEQVIIRRVENSKSIFATHRNLFPTSK